MHAKLLQITKESLNGQRPSTLYIYVCIYSSFLLNIKVEDKTFQWFLSLKYKGFVKLSK